MIVPYKLYRTPLRLTPTIYYTQLVLEISIHSYELANSFTFWQHFRKLPTWTRRRAGWTIKGVEQECCFHGNRSHMPMVVGIVRGYSLSWIYKNHLNLNTKTSWRLWHNSDPDPTFSWGKVVVSSQQSWFYGYILWGSAFSLTSRQHLYDVALFHWCVQNHETLTRATNEAFSSHQTALPVSGWGVGTCLPGIWYLKLTGFCMCSFFINQHLHKYLSTDINNGWIGYIHPVWALQWQLLDFVSTTWQPLSSAVSCENKSYNTNSSSASPLTVFRNYLQHVLCR